MHLETTYSRLPAIERIAAEIMPPTLSIYLLTERDARLKLKSDFLKGRRQLTRLTAFGHYIRCWMARRGLQISTTSSAKNVVDSYHDRLLLAGESLAGAQISQALGHDRSIHLSFWSKKDRLDILLDYCGLSASQILVDLMKYPVQCLPDWQPFPEPAEALALLDWFRSPDKAAREIRLMLFRDFVTERELLQKHNMAFALMFAGLPAVATEVERTRASARLKQTLNGQYVGWTCQRLDLLAKHNELDLQKLASDFCLWLEKLAVTPPLVIQQDPARLAA